MSRKLMISLSNLYLDLRNPRYEEQASQNEALNTIASEQKGKLLVLLKDILVNGLNPSDMPIVMPAPQKENGYIVLEGNRRIAALKLFKKPRILTNVAMQQRYRKLHDVYKNKSVNTVECLLVNSREEANLWIERKHEGEMNGAGTVKWNSVQSERFRANKTGRGTKAVQLIDFMKAAELDDAVFFEEIAKVSVTNLERFLSTPDVRTTLGLEINNGEYFSRYEWAEVQKGLKTIVRRFNQEDFSVRDIYRKEDRMRFLSKIPLEELPDKSKKAESTWKLNDFSPQNIKSGQTIVGTGSVNMDDAEQTDTQLEIGSQTDDEQQQERPTSRTTFLPETLTLSIPSDRINRIYSELKLLSHLSMPNTCAVMLRVFLELSVDKYMEAFKLLKNGALTGARDSRDLKQKTNEVIHHMKQTKMADEAIIKGIKTEVNKDSSLSSIDTMNAYVHNGDFNPIPENLMLTWDNIQPFMIALWKAVNDKQK
ncbi:MAG: hypothetical protein IJ534_01110 [Bacteroidaceae bacterium]|nr:hypothetical protein [Bacteroidaceae bacterium]